MSRRAFSLVEMLVVVTILSVLIVISTPLVVAGKVRANEASAMGSLRVIASQQVTYREHDDGGEFAPDLPSLGAAQLIDEVLSAGTKAGYRFETHHSSDSPGAAFCALASPLLPGDTGDHYYFVDQSGQIYLSDEEPTLDLATCEVPADMRPLDTGN